MPEAPGKTYDLAVIGGGIAGCAVARDAALRGLSTAVFEKNVLGSGASCKSSKLIHGGVRYLELAWLDLLRLNLAGAFKNFRFVVSSLRETRVLARTAPGLVRPVRLFVPVYRGRSRSLSAVYAGTWLYGWLSRLAGNDAAVRTFRGPGAALAALPLLEPTNLAGGVEIADYTTDDRHLVLAVAAAARQAGAAFFEHAAVKNWEKTPDGYRLNVNFDGGEKTFYARTVVNASGPWIDRTRGKDSSAEDRYVSPVGGSHIEVASFLGRSAILEAGDGRVFFVIERGGRARVGTTEWPAADPDDTRVPESDVDYLLEGLGRYFPFKKWNRSDVLASDAGIRPLAADPSAKNANRVSREHEIRRDADGVFHLAGVKLTDHRRAAEKTVDRVLAALGRRGPRSKTAITPLPA